MKMLSYNNLKKIDGWLGFSDFEIFKSLISYQNDLSTGALVEVGVHRGKSFALIAAASGGSMLYAIDIFDNQSANIDSSGSGNLTHFLNNISKFGIDINRIIIDSRISSEVNPRDILDRVGPVRFFHIDGGHHYDAVCADLKLAIAVSTIETVIAIDDLFRPEWPEVSAAVFGVDGLVNSGFVTFAVGYNKTYFCHKEMISKYQNRLEHESRLIPFLSKKYETNGRVVIIFQNYPMSEWNLSNRIKWYTSIWHPNFYIFSWHLIKLLRRKWRQSL